MCCRSTTMSRAVGHPAARLGGWDLDYPLNGAVPKREGDGVQRLLSDLKSKGEPEPEAIALLLEKIMAEGGYRAEPDYLMLCLDELKGWADYAIAQLQKYVE